MARLLLFYVDHFNIYVFECNPWNIFAQEPFISTDQKDAHLPPFTVVLQHHTSPHSLISVDKYHADKPKYTTNPLPCYEALKLWDLRFSQLWY